MGNQDDLYCLFKKCFEMVTDLNTDKGIGLGLQEELHQTYIFYTVIVGSGASEAMATEEPTEEKTIIQVSFEDG